MRRLYALLFNEVKSSKSFPAASRIYLMRLCGGIVIGFSQVVLARLMGAKGFGDYAVILSWISCFVVVSVFGLDTSALRMLPAYAKQEDWKKWFGLQKFSKRILLLLASGSSMALLLFLFSNSNRYQISFSEGMFWALVALPVVVFIYYYSTLLKAFQKFKTSLLPLNFLLPAIVSTASFIYYRLNHSLLKVDAVLFIFLCATLPVFLFTSRKVKKEIRRQPAVGDPEYVPGKWLTKSAFYCMGSMTMLLTKMSGILFISYFFGNTHAGIYAVALLISSWIPLAASFIEKIVAPQLRELAQADDPGKTRLLSRHISRMILLTTIPMGLVIMVAGRFLLLIFGTAFIAAWVPLILLTAGQLCISATGIPKMIFERSGNQRMLLVIHLLSGLLSVVLNLMLVPKLGMNGAALASVISLVTVNCTIVLIARKKAGRSFQVPIFGTI